MPASYNRDLIYKTLCKALVDTQDDLQWGSFTVSDWRALVPFARSQGVAPLLHYYTKRRDWGDQLPVEVREALEREYYASAAYNQLLFSELRRILEALGEAGIPVIVLKGAAVAHTLYPDPALRPMNDIDLLVKPEHLFPAIKTLKQIGYHQQKITYHVVLAGGPDSRVNLELHWLLLPSRDPEALITWVWDRVVPFQLSGLDSQACFALDPGASFLYLAAHLGLAHGSNKPRLVWLYDLFHSLAVADPISDFSELTEKAVRFGWSLAVNRSLSALELRFGPDLPDQLFEQITGVTDQSDEQFMYSDQNDYAHSFSRQSIRVFSLRRRYSILMGTIFPSVAYMKDKYRLQKGWLWPVGYLRRMADLLINHGSN